MGPGPGGHLTRGLGRPNQRGLHRQRPPRHRRRAFPRASRGRWIGVAGGGLGHRRPRRRSRVELLLAPARRRVRHHPLPSRAAAGLHRAVPGPRSPATQSLGRRSRRGQLEIRRPARQERLQPHQWNRGQQERPRKRRPPGHRRPQRQRRARPTQQLLPVRDRPVVEPLRSRRHPKRGLAPVPRAPVRPPHRARRLARLHPHRIRAPDAFERAAARRSRHRTRRDRAGGDRGQQVAGRRRSATRRALPDWRPRGPRRHGPRHRQEPELPAAARREDSPQRAVAHPRTRAVARVGLRKPRAWAPDVGDSNPDPLGQLHQL